MMKLKAAISFNLMHETGIIPIWRGVEEAYRTGYIHPFTRNNENSNELTANPKKEEVHWNLIPKEIYWNRNNVCEDFVGERKPEFVWIF